MKNEPEKELTLVVKASPIKGEGGVARIHDDILKQLGVEEGKSIAVSSESDSILLTIYGDKIIDKKQISIREEDTEKLGVSDGETVKLNIHKTMKESFGKSKDEDD